MLATLLVAVVGAANLRRREEENLHEIQFLFEESGSSWRMLLAGRGDIFTTSLAEG